LAQRDPISKSTRTPDAASARRENRISIRKTPSTTTTARPLALHAGQAASAKSTAPTTKPYCAVALLGGAPQAKIHGSRNTCRPKTTDKVVRHDERFDAGTDRHAGHHIAMSRSLRSNADARADRTRETRRSATERNARQRLARGTEKDGEERGRRGDEQERSGAQGRKKGVRSQPAAAEERRMSRNPKKSAAVNREERSAPRHLLVAERDEREQCPIEKSVSRRTHSILKADGSGFASRSAEGLHRPSSLRKRRRH